MNKNLKKVDDNSSLDNKKTSKTKLQVHSDMIINVFMISLLFIGSIFIFIMASTIMVENNELIIEYDEQSNISYNVLLKPNEYYPTTTLGMNQQYPSSAIDKININYNYKFKTSEKSNYRYKYFVTETVIVNNRNTTINSNNLLLSRTYQLEDNVVGDNISSDEFNLEKLYSINYQKYRDFINGYRNFYSLNIDSYLRVSMYVEVVDEYNGNVIGLNKTMDVNISLSDNPVTISINNPKDISNKIYSKSKKTKTSYYFIVIAILMLVVSILLFIQEIFKVMKNEKAQSRYLNKLNKIISSNSEVIIKAKNKLNLKDYNIIDVETIETLLDVQNELRIPIVYFDIKYNEEGWFVIVSNNEVWRYIYKIDDLK